jgi:hypothetical protein
MKRDEAKNYTKSMEKIANFLAKRATRTIPTPASCPI